VSRVGLVLGAGGVTGGAFHAGVLSTLQEVTGWDPRTAALLVGTSAGSGTAGALRAGLSAPDMAARACGEPLSAEGVALLESARMPVGPPPVPTGLRARVGRPAAPEVLAAAIRRPWRVRPGAVLAGLLPAGATSTTAISEGMNALHPQGWPSDPLWVCAVRLRDGALVVFGSNGAPTVSVGDAVAASCAIPGFFSPVEIDGVRYVDGGAHSFTNVGKVVGEDLDLVIVSAPMGRSSAGSYAPGSAVREAGRVQLRVELQRLRRAGTPVLVLQPTPRDEQAMGVNAMDPSRRAAVVAQVKTSVRSQLESPAVQDQLALLT
jgi:NTE family protein